VKICSFPTASNASNELDCRTGSVGVLDPNCECKLLDDNGNEVQDGEPGEVYVRGPNVTMGYWKNEQATRETMLPGGWLRSGDIAICRGDWFWIVDRKKVGSPFSTCCCYFANNRQIGAYQGQWIASCPCRIRGCTAGERRRC
jgi:acyl-CoA synthetase (AMP-forming)/AMP-acid ligase II